MVKNRNSKSEWWPKKPPIYDIEKSYLENFEEGPFFDGSVPRREVPPKEQWVDFLGFPVATPIGVPAGPLLNSRFVTFAARMGFDVVTYKTIRSQKHPAHPLPNMIYVEAPDALAPEEEGKTLHQATTPPKDMASVGTTNSFGIPSRDPDYLIADIAKADSSLAEGQVMIVSIVGTPREGEDFTQDFVKTAEIALEGGAKIIEADYSCPNVASREGSIHRSPETIYTISKALKESLHGTPLIIKLGMIAEKGLLQEVLLAAARAGVDAICGINTLSMKIVNGEGNPALGENRLRAGLCGGPIREAALQFITHAREIIEKEKLDMKLMGTGGVTLPQHFDHFFEAGADVAMSAVGMMWDPYLATKRRECCDVTIQRAQNDGGKLASNLER